MKVLVTGITGFIGQRLLLKLPASDEIFAVCLPSTGGLPGHVRVIEADLSYPEQLFKELKVIRPESCVHLAWEGIPDYGFQTSRKNLEQGVSLWRYLVEECGCRKILATGSCWEYGKAFGSCREDESVITDSYFVWAKRALSELGMMLAAKNGISFVWTRLFYIYGPGQRSGALIPNIAEALKKGECPVAKTPHNANDFVFVDDVAEALLLALTKDVPTGIYNLGTGKTVPAWKVCEIMEKAMGHQPLFSAEMRQSEVKANADFWADTAKSENVLGWRGRTEIEEGIRHYLRMLEAKQ